MYRIASILSMLLFLGATAFAQSSPGAAHQASVIRIRVEYVSPGTGGGGYKTSRTTVEPTFLLWELRNSPDPKKWPNRKGKRTLKKGEWQKLEHAIDLKSLSSVKSETCYGTVDQYTSCSTFEIDLADRKKIAIMFDQSKIPVPIAAVLKNFPEQPIVALPLGRK